VLGLQRDAQARPAVACRGVPGQVAQAQARVVEPPLAQQPPLPASSRTSEESMRCRSYFLSAGVRGTPPLATIKWPFVVEQQLVRVDAAGIELGELAQGAPVAHAYPAAPVFRSVSVA
jgi:hypothetical protein